MLTIKILGLNNPYLVKIEGRFQRLREMYARNPPGAFHRSFLYAVRNQFGFHYKPEEIEAKLEEFLAIGTFEAEVIHAEELSGLSRYVIADHVSIGILQDILNAELPDLHEVFDKAMSQALALARDLSDVVDLMLLPLLERTTSLRSSGRKRAPFDPKSNSRMPNSRLMS